MGPVERSRIDHERIADAVLLGQMRVAVAHEIVLTAVNRFLQQGAVITVQESDSPAVHVQFSKSLVAGLPGGLDGLTQPLGLRVDVAPNEVGWPTLEAPYDLLRADVAAMDHQLDLAALEHAHGGPSELDMSMRVADNPDNHEKSLEPAADPNRRGQKRP